MSSQDSSVGSAHRAQLIGYLKECRFGDAIAAAELYEIDVRLSRVLLSLSEEGEMEIQKRAQKRRTPLPHSALCFLSPCHRNVLPLSSLRRIVPVMISSCLPISTTTGCM
jgi:hypothetical protein